MEPEDCPLCYSTMNDETPLKQLTCNHKFHKDCIESTIIFNLEHDLPRLCPLCRNEIDRIDYPANLEEHLPPVPPRRIITMQDWPFDITAPSDYIRLSPEDDLDFFIKISDNEPLRLVNNRGTTIVNIGELCPIHSIDQIEIPPNEQNIPIETIEELAELSWRNVKIAHRDLVNAQNYNYNAIFKRNLEIILRRQQLPIEKDYNQRILAIAYEQNSTALELYALMRLRRLLAEARLYYLDKKNLNNSLAQIIEELPKQSTTINGLQELYDNATELKQRAEDNLRTINYMPIQEYNFREEFIEAKKNLKSIIDYHYDEVLSEATKNLKSIIDYQANIKSQLDYAKTRIGSIKLSLRNRTKNAKNTLATIGKSIKKSMKKSMKKVKQLKNRLLMRNEDEDEYQELLGGKHDKPRKSRKSRKLRKY